MDSGHAVWRVARCTVSWCLFVGEDPAAPPGLPVSGVPALRRQEGRQLALRSVVRPSETCSPGAVPVVSQEQALFLVGLSRWGSWPSGLRARPWGRVCQAALGSRSARCRGKKLKP